MLNILNNKYKLTDNTKNVNGHTLYQIKALKDFGLVKKGELGGWIENYNNLSQIGTAWVYDNARVYGYATVCNNARVYDNAHVHDNAHIYDDVKVYGNAHVYDNALVYDNAIVCDRAIVSGNAQVCNNAMVYGNAIVSGKAKVYEYAGVFGNALVYGNAKVYGDSKIQGDISIRDNDEIKDNKSYLIFKNTWSSGRYFVYVLSNHHWHVGCFDGTSEELIKKAYQDSELSGKMYELYVHIAKQVIETQQQLEEM